MHPLSSPVAAKTQGASSQGFGNRGFTLMELLAVIGIIALLIALLIPTVTTVRMASYQAATKQEVQQIVSACNNYYQDFRAYPGPVSNTDMESMIYGNSTVTQPFSTSTNPFNVCQPSMNNIYYSSEPFPIGPSGSQQNLLCGNTNASQQILGTGSFYNTPASAAGTGFMLFTPSENLVLGLLGGLWRNPNNINTTTNLPQLEFVNGQNTNGSSGGTYVNPTTLIGTGPRNLAPGAAGAAVPTNNKQYSSYLPLTFPGSKLLYNGDGSPENGQAPYHDYNGRSFGDCAVPVFTDQFPDSMPILYLRARVGAHGVVSGPGNWPGGSGSPTLMTDPTIGGLTAHYNYDITGLLPYTLYFAGYSTSGAPNPGPPTVPQIKPIVGHGLQAVGDNPGTGSYGAMPYFPVSFPAPANQGYDHPVPTNYLYNAGEYFLDASIQPGYVSSPNTYNNQQNADLINATGTPRAKDEFIIITAGRDRIYGTSDDITSFGDVEP